MRRARGAPRPAALLLDRAARADPARQSDDAVRRAVEAAYLHFESGDAESGRGAAPRADRADGAGPLRARRRCGCSRASAHTKHPTRRRSSSSRSWTRPRAKRDTPCRATKGLRRAACTRWSGSMNVPQHADHSARARRELGDEALEGDVLISRLGLRRCAGIRPRGETARGGTGAADGCGRPAAPRPAAHSRGGVLVWTDEYPRARKEDLVELHAAALTRSGDESATAVAPVPPRRARVRVRRSRRGLRRAREGQDCRRAVRSAAVLRLQPRATRASCSPARIVQAKDARSPFGGLLGGTSTTTRRPRHGRGTRSSCARLGPPERSVVHVSIQRSNSCAARRSSSQGPSDSSSTTSRR